MMKDRDQLASFLTHKVREYISNTIKITKDGYMYSFPCSSDMAKDIIKFLAMTPEERNAEIEKSIEKNVNIDWEGNLRDGHGKRIAHSESLATLLVREAELKKVLKEVQKAKKEFLK
jgi:hypothetical protein